MKKWITKTNLSIVLLSTLALSACSSTTSTATEALAAATSSTATISTTAATVSSSTALKVSDLVTFDSGDDATDWESSDYTGIQLKGSSATITGKGASVANGVITIKAGGTYVLSGQLTDGQITVDAQDEEDVILVLNGVTITDHDSAPIYIKEAKNAFITLAEGTENVITDGAEYTFADDTTDEPSAAIFSKADLTINGEGTLSVHANYKDGITSKDDLKIVSGTLNITATDDGIVGKDMVAIEDGTFNIVAGGDGIKSTNDTDADKGFIAIAGGTFDIQSTNDGIQSEKQLVIDNGTFNILSGGGHTKAEAKVEEQPGQGGGFGGPQGQDAQATATSTTKAPTDTTISTDNTTSTDTSATATESISTKGLKATGDMTINGGTFTIDSADDAVHSNASVHVTGGTLAIATGDDAIHGDVDLNISGGKINITTSYEGLEATNINVSGGDTHVIATDDGVNASGDANTTTTEATTESTTTATATEASTATTIEANTSTATDPAGNHAPPGGFGGGEGSSQNALLNIIGGTLTVDAQGDGLDSNGSITMSGGTVIVNGPTTNGNGPLDYDGTFEMTGGYVVAVGSSGMAQAPSDDSTQSAISMSYSATQAAGTLVHIQDSTGKNILTLAPTKDYQSVVISSPDLVKGSSYAIYTGGTSTGTLTDGLYTGGEYTGGTKVVNFELASTITWVNESGVTTANTGFGGGGGQRPTRNMNNHKTGTTTDSTSETTQ